jgi:hypothetical protein
MKGSRFMSRSRWSIALTAFCLGIMASRSAIALCCGGDFISEGDSKFSVREKCVEPTWIDVWMEEIVNFPDTDIEHRLGSFNERWIYNNGPTEFLQIVTFKGSKVFSIETGSRGFTLAPGPQTCNFNGLSLGVTSAEVAAQCGEPDVKERRYETITQPIAGGRRHISVSVDEWTFNLGPTRFIRTLTFRNGTLVEISTGEKGFSR